MYLPAPTMSTAFDFTGLLAPETESDTPKINNYENLKKQSPYTREIYNNKRRSNTKNFKRYNQFQPRNRGTNHTLMRKGNTW